MKRILISVLALTTLVPVLVSQEIVGYSPFIEYPGTVGGERVTFSIAWPTPDGIFPNDMAAFFVYEGDEEQYVFPVGKKRSDTEIAFTSEELRAAISLRKRDVNGEETWVGSLFMADTKEDLPVVLKSRRPNDPPEPPGGDGRRFDYDKSNLEDLRNFALEEWQVEHWTYAQARYAINYVYARNGYAFKQGGPIRSVFDEMDWYRPYDGLTMEQIDARMKEVERANIRVLAAVRDARK